MHEIFSAKVLASESNYSSNNFFHMIKKRKRLIEHQLYRKHCDSFSIIKILKNMIVIFTELKVPVKVTMKTVHLNTNYYKNDGRL